MLPQRKSTKPAVATRLPALDEQDPVETATITRSRARETPKPVDASSKSVTSMLPPSATGRSRSIRETPQTRQTSQQSSNPSSRRSSLAKPSDRDAFKTPGKPVTAQEPKKVPAVGQSSMHRRSMSQQAGHTPKSSISSLPSRTPSQRHSSLRVPKPAFSAMQQHYSPKKKPSTLSLNESSSQEPEFDYDVNQFQNLQVELTQLHMIHRTTANVQQQWEQSARESFQTRFNDLCTRHIELKEIAHQQRTLFNQLALVEWCQGVPSTHVAEKVQQASRNIADIRSLLEPEGKYTRVLEVFQSWFARARQIESSRGADTIETRNRDLAFIEGIGDGWKAEAMVLERELTYCLRELKGFGEIRAVSSLGRILSLHKTLVSNLLEELDVVQWIEHETMVHESTWMEQTIDKLSSNVSDNI